MQEYATGFLSGSTGVSMLLLEPELAVLHMHDSSQVLSPPISNRHLQPSGRTTAGNTQAPLISLMSGEQPFEPLHADNQRCCGCDCCFRLAQMTCSSRAWAGMSHQAVVQAGCVDKLRLVFPDTTPEPIVMLAEACMSFDAAERPTFQDILDILTPLNTLLLPSGSG